MSKCKVCKAKAVYYEDIQHAVSCPYSNGELMRSMPLPRLQLRWTDGPNDGFARRWACHYELVLPLRKLDIRNDAKHGFMVIPLGKTFRGSETEPDDTPFRDHSHALWDSEALGNIPVYLITYAGVTKLVVRKEPS